MTLAQLLSQLRIELDDITEDYLWSDEELTFYLNEAEREACRRARLIIDSSNVEFTQIETVENIAIYPISPKIIRILEIIPSWGTRPLRRATMQEMNMSGSNWRNRFDALPDTYICDFETNKIRLVGIPSTVGFLNMRVYRTPASDMDLDEATDIEPEIKEIYHGKLIHWAKHRAYLKPDADTYDKDASDRALAMFVEEFGEAKSAWSEEYDARNLPNDLYDGQY